MKKNLLFILLTSLSVLFMSLGLSAQTYHNVSVTNFEFDPPQLSINVGDTVVWANVLGQHNVNGNQITFPDNPESFGNGPGPAGWSLTVIFDTPGTYSYRCDVHPDIMFGSVTVSGSSVSVGEIDEPNRFDFYPNPVRNELHWKWNSSISPTDATIQIYDVTGKLTDKFQLGFESHKDVSNWTEGMYIYTITRENQPIQAGKLFIVK